MNNHYPERVTRICVVNAPFFAGAAWRVLQAVLPQSVQDKIELTADPGPGLMKYIDPGLIPACYQGASPLSLFESEEEALLRAAVAQANAAGGGGSSNGSSSSSAARVGPVAPAPVPAPSTPTPTTPSASASGSGSGGGGGGWLPSLFGSGGGKGKGKGKGRPQQAHLGYENRFVFDQQRKMWVLEEERPPLKPHTTPLARPTVAAPLVVTALPVPSPAALSPARHQAAPPHASLSLPPSPAKAAAAGWSPLRTAAAGHDAGEDEEAEEEGSDLDDEDDGDDEEKQTGAGGAAAEGDASEEDGLILAIQAAHYAERLAREKGRAHPSTLLLLGAEEGAAGSAGSASGTAVGGVGKEGGLGGGGADAGLTMLLQTALVYTLWAGLEGVVHAVLPVWVAAPHHLGGCCLGGGCIVCPQGKSEVI